ncbi:MAG: peptide-binding protein [Caldimicrobium sp.]|nr:peptide-binding protein [Caldimicrobium sp.]MCX7612791.1 peptide-binding protein [Caldimicrobium sp.]MDW8182143.1 peptide-binding protein [Caldimicrobium sp.]
MVFYRISSLLSFILIIHLTSLFSVAELPKKLQENDGIAKVIKPDFGDALVIGTIADASILLPMLATDAMSHNVARHIFRGIVEYAPDLSIVGDLAERFEVSKDQREITFYLKRGVKWEDGVEVTAYDVEFGFKLITNPEIPSSYASDFLEVKEFKVLHPHAFKVIYKRPFALALSSWGNLVVLPRHLLQDKDLKYLQGVFGRRPLGNGPYKLKTWETQNRIILEYNPTYSEGRAYLDRLIYRVIPDPSTLFMELRSFGVDWITLTPLQFRKVEEEPKVKENFQIYRYLAFAYTYLGYNLRDPLFKDKRVRKALCHAIDKRRIVGGALLGQGIQAYGPYKPDAWFYNPNIEKICSYDPEKALKLLEEAGFKRGGDGILYKDGKPFEFTILTNQGNLARLLAAQIIQQDLSKLGIKVNIRVMEWTTLIHQFIDKRRFQAVILGWTTGPDPDLYDIFHSSKVKSPGLNFVGYQNPEVDRLLEEGRYTLDREKRKAIYFKMQELLVEDQPYTFLYIPMSLEAIHKRFRGIKPSAIGISYNIERWWVPKSEQKYIVP